ncbi:MAG: aldolase catalytic domain-containing protein [Candidatus Marinamargulisbacteria bacterium]
MSKLNVLDCTIRDGGYYNNWNFTDEEFINSITALIKSGVDTIELGYKSLESARFFGPYKYCNESFLRTFEFKGKCSFACMVDSKEFIENKAGLNHVLPNQDMSIFSMVRVATSLSIINESIQLALEIKRKGYEVCLNLMGVSLASDDELRLILSKIPKEIDVVYFADSFGNLYPKDIQRIYKIFKENLDGQNIGFHPHDNLGLAFANSIEAIECGINYIDGTILGMGRGAGNLKLEQLLTFLKFEKKNNQYSSYPLIDVIQNHYLQLQNHYEWGFDLTYMLSGINNTHQSYCQSLKSDKRYNYQQVFDILSNISAEKRSKFEKGELVKSMERTFSFKKTRQLGSLSEINKDNVLIVAKGQSISDLKKSLNLFIEEKSPVIFDCNNSGVFQEFSRYVCMINTNKLKDLNELDKNVKGIINPFDTNLLPNDIENITIGYSLDRTLNYESDSIGISAYLVGQYAIMSALMLEFKNIYLAGFDGFSVMNEEQADMERFFNALKNSLNLDKILSLTPTKYNIRELSLFTLIQDEKVQSCYSSKT